MRAAAFLFLLLPLLVLLGSGCFTCHAQKLVQEEVDALKQIGAKLRKNWDFSVDPCSRTAGWVVPSFNPYIVSNLTCNCTSTTCHVVSIWLKGQNLTGELPAEFANLTQLSFLDLRRNYLNGIIPVAWASLPLINLSLLGNRISGNIPDELGDMITLESLELDDNQLQGPIPATLGKLISLKRLHLSGNNFSGELPDLGNLKNMTDFRIDGNPISGKIPSFIGNWTQLQRLDMLGTSLEGPFPPIFATLSSITQLSVSDWKGGDGKFPPLQNMKGMEYLYLRNLSISGQLPDYIGSMNKLDTLDISFNNLSGTIPGTFVGLQSTSYIFLTNNMLQGSIPHWILSSKYNLDVSYNNFTGTPAPPACQQGNVNLMSSYSSTDNSISPCLQRNFPCSKKPRNYKLFINCGGSKVTSNDNEYEDDSSPLGAARYAISEKIMFTDDDTFSSLGRRLFDVSIQSQKVLHDFDIVKEANGTGKGIIKTFTASADGTLEIDLYWAGKGITAIPRRSVYGPLISAISVTPNFNPTTSDGKISLGAIVGIVVSVCVLILLLLLAILWIYLRRRNSKRSEEFKGLELQTGHFSLKQIKSATRNFDPANKIGEGGFGPVYKGVLSDGSEIAVKQLSSKSNQGNREFVNEIGLISALEHPNLVKLYGCCIEGNQLFLIYEYLENNSLARALFGPERSRLNLNWQTRRKICLGIAKGLTYLHEESTLKIVHKDIKSTNVLLDRDLKAKISDFGLAKLHEEENTHISTRIAGTFGYMAPEYAMRGYLTDKADVYSFGIVMLEIVSGTANSNYRPKEDMMCLVDWANILAERGSLLELVDPKLESSYSKEEALQMLNLVLLCTNPSPSARPLMSTVVSMLEGKIPVHLPPLNPSASKLDDTRPKTFEKLSHDSQLTSGSVDDSWTDSSAYHVSRIESAILSESRSHSDNVD